MAIYHCSLQNISRAAGRSAIAAAAYRSTSRIVDRRTGVICDYTKKKQALAAGIELPADAPAWAADRAELWNRAEEKENRKNSILAREINVAIPCEITNQDDREKLIKDYCKTITAQGLACDWAIHAPDAKGDRRNHHAHIMFTTRAFEGGDWAKNKPHRTKDEAREWVNRHRENWETCANQVLYELHKRPRIDRRSLEAQGIGRTPQQHQGVTAAQMERRGAKPDRTRRKNLPEFISETYKLLEGKIEFVKAKLNELSTLPETLILNREYNAADPKKSYDPAVYLAQIDRERGRETEQSRKIIDAWRTEKRTPPRAPKTETAEQADKRKLVPAALEKPEAKTKAAKQKPERKPEIKPRAPERKPETREEAVSRISAGLKTKTPEELAALKNGMQSRAEREALTLAAVPLVEKDLSEKRNANGLKVAARWNEPDEKLLAERDRLAAAAAAVEKAKKKHKTAPDASVREAALQPVKNYADTLNLDYAAREKLKAAAAEKLKKEPEFENYRRWAAAIGAAMADRQNERKLEQRQRGIERGGRER